MYVFVWQSYRDYHADLYPDTTGSVTYLSAPMWLDNQDHPVPNISLHPDANNGTQVSHIHYSQLYILVVYYSLSFQPKKSVYSARVGKQTLPVNWFY